MLDYLSNFVNNNGVAFPNTAAINASGGAATDGTEFIANMVNDSMWGVWQSLMDYTGLTPNGIVEAVGASQILEAFRRFETPGKIVSMVLNDDPAVLGIRALQLTGQGILRANYVELDNNVYVGDGNNAAVAAAGGAFYRADDAAGVTPNIAGIYLILPDARGRVVRGLDLTGSVDPAGVGRFLGDFQDDSIQGHRFLTVFDESDIGASPSLSNLNSMRRARAAGTDVDYGLYAATGGEEPDVSRTSNPITDGVNGTPKVDSESRMINLSANLMITY